MCSRVISSQLLQHGRAVCRMPKSLRTFAHLCIESVDEQSRDFKGTSVHFRPAFQRPEQNHPNLGQYVPTACAQTSAFFESDSSLLPIFSRLMLLSWPRTSRPRRGQRPYGRKYHGWLQEPVTPAALDDLRVCGSAFERFLRCCASSRCNCSGARQQRWPARNRVRRPPSWARG